MIGDDEVQEPAATEQIKRPEPTPVQRTSACAGGIPSEDHQLLGQAFDFRDDRGGQSPSDVFFVRVVLPGPALTHPWRHGVRRR